MYQRISVSFTYVATLIGAGFASGREISLYFAHTSVVTPLIAGVLLGLFCYVFLELGRFCGGELAPLFGRGRRLVDLTVAACNFVIYAAMLAASESVIFNLFGIHGGAIITAGLVLLIMFFGVGKVRLLNFLVVPFIIILLGVLLFSDTNNTLAFERFSVLPAFTYTTMNVITGGYFVSTLSKDFSKRDSLQTAALSGIVLTVLLVIVYTLIQQDIDAEMPLLEKASSLGYSTVGNIILYLAVFTTLTSCLTVSSKGKFSVSALLTAGGLAVSILGFKTIVNTAYPIIGTIGSVLSLYCVFLLCKHTMRRQPLLF